MAVAVGAAELAIRFLKLVEARQGEAAAEMIADDAVWWVLGLGAVCKADVLKAHAGIYQFTDRTTFDIIGQITEGDRAAIEVLVTYHFKDGRIVENPMHIAFTFLDGRIAAVREYMDTAALAAFAAC